MYKCGTFSAQDDAPTLARLERYRLGASAADLRWRLLRLFCKSRYMLSPRALFAEGLCNLFRGLSYYC